MLHACLCLKYQVLHRLFFLVEQMCLSRLHQVLWQLAPDHLIKARVVASLAHIELLHHDCEHVLSVARLGDVLCRQLLNVALAAISKLNFTFYQR